MATYLGPFNLLLPAGVKQNGSDVFNILDPDGGGAATFSVPCAVGGIAPVTFWGARSLLEEATHNALTAMTTQQFKDYVDALAVTRGRQPVGSITAFKNALIIGDGAVNFLSFLTANGVTRIVTSPF